MNKRRVLLLMLFACLIPLSVWADYDISVNRTNLTFGSASSSEAVAITSNDSWTVSSNNSWCTVSLSNGNHDGTVTISVSENTAKYARSAVVTLKGSHAQSVTVYVTQDGTTGIGRDDYGDDKDLDLDTVPPILLQSIPENGAVNMVTKGEIVLTFDEAIKIADNLKATLNGKQLNSPYIGSAFISFNYSGLDYNKEYTFVLPANSVSDLSGNYLKEDIRLTFTTEDDYSEEPGELTLTLTPNRIEEGTEEYVKLIVKRSGKWSNAETVNLKSNEDSRISVPPTITIPARQSAAVAYLSISNNEVVDKDSVVEITAMSDKYKPVTARLLIEDDDFPQLIVTSSKSVVSEGETFQLTVSTDRVTSAPIEITLTSENTKRFTFPRKAIIPAGKTSVTVDVTAKDDDIPSETLSNVFTVSAARYNQGEYILILEDNDMPVLQLTLTPNKVTEGAGPVSVAGVLRRTGVTNNKITVRLSDDSNGNLYFPTRELTLNAGVEEASFNFGPIDNAQVDGDHTYTVTAAVWLSSCSCSAAGESAGLVSAPLQVLDDDGPALTLTSTMSTIKEGDKATLTVSRNTLVSLDQPLTVTLSSDYDENLSYDHTVTIPAGQQTVQVEITSKKNDVSGDSHTVVFTVQANGYASGTCWLMVTDQTLPDAVITNISVDKSEVEAEEKFYLTLTVKNFGFETLPSLTPISIYEDEHTLIGHMYTQSSVKADEATTMTKGFILSSLTGNHQIFAVINEDRKWQELQYTNNTSETVTVHLLPAFTSTVEVGNALYSPREEVDIQGTVRGKKVAGTNVEVYFLNNGLRQTVNVAADESGHFQLNWKPKEKQVGHFIVGACSPGEGSNDAQASFDVIGLMIAERYSMAEVEAGTSVTDSLTIFNPCGIALTDIHIEVSDVDNFSIASQVIERLEPGKTAILYYSITGQKPTEGRNWQDVPIRLICNEGTQTKHLLYCYVHSPQARLETNILNIQATMTKGKTREYPLVIKNTGKGNTGRIIVDTGQVPWMSCATATDLQSLDFGDSTTVVLRFSPTEEMQINSILEGRLAINCENGTGCTVGLSVETVSEETGSLVVDVWDEYTYFTAEAPHVSGATVKVTHPTSGFLLASGITDASGICTFTLPEGSYNIAVEKGKHESFSENVMVDPGKETLQRVTILLETVQVSIGFEQTEVDDMYHITTTIEYETNVPTPVVLVNLPDSIPVTGMRCGESILIEAVVTNKGLIEAIDTHLEFPVIAGLKFTVLENELFNLPAQQSILVPVLVTRYCTTEDSNNGQNAGGQGVVINYPGADVANMPCYIPVYLYYGVNCDDQKKGVKSYRKYLGLKPCPPLVIDDVLQTELPAPGGGGGGGGGKTVIRSGNRPIIMPDCDYKYNNAYAYLGKFIECLVKGIGRNLPVFGQGFGVAFCLDDLEQCARGKKTDLKCAHEMTNCYIYIPDNEHTRRYKKVKQIASPFTSFFNCHDYLKQFFDSVSALPSGEPLTTRNIKESKKNFPDYIYEYQERLDYAAMALQGGLDYLKELFGNEDFLYSDIEDVQQLLAYMCTCRDDELRNYTDMLSYKPDNISEEDFIRFVQRIENTILRNNGKDVETENYIHAEVIETALDKIAGARTYSTSHGFDSTADMMERTMDDAEARQSKERESICARVTLQINQEMTLKRQAIRATLKVRNGHESNPMGNVLLNIEVRDADGIVATEREFQISTESLYGFKGELDVSSNWTLEAQQTGTATVLMIPTKHAAPDGPKNYIFGGYLSYSDPYTGTTVVREFSPQMLTIYPTPDLELTYLMQRDVYGDDPLTEDVVEPMEEAEFALIINNKGNGEAKNVRMLTEQPKIIENEKGLFIDFDIVSSQVNGEPANLSLGQTIANDFGTIDARSQAYAQWWLRSTLLGHFTSYEVQATHVTSYGNKDLSLVDTVTIHEMIHGFTTASDGHGLTRRGWLVNDIVDADDMPDVVYFTDATQQSLYMATGSIERLSDLEFRLTATAKQAGWNYGSVTDPTGGRQKLVRIVRQSDGAELPVDNVWQTDRTLRDGRDWFYENRLHFVGDMQNGSETYVLTFEERPEVELAVQEFIGVPPEGVIQETPLDAVTVRFNKAIQEETFTADDITLHCQGERQDEKAIGITKQNETDYVLNLSRVNQQDGYYVLTVQTAGITDREGFNGRDGKSASWVQYVNTVEPETYFYVTTTPAGYATFYDSQWAWQLPTELQASVVSSASENKLTYTALDGNVVPKGVPVMLTSNPKQAGTYTLTGAESEAVYSGANLLRGSDMPTMATPEDGERLYILAYGPSRTKWSEVFGWYWGAENGGAFQIEGHKAWLAVPTGVARTRGYAVDGISVETDGQQIPYADMYDLLGRKVSLEPARRLHKGVYIQNRKKVIIK